MAARQVPYKISRNCRKVIHPVRVDCGHRSTVFWPRMLSFRFICNMSAMCAAHASGMSSSVAEVWRGVAGIDREGAEICCFFMFSIDCARGCLGRLGWLVCADCSSTLKYRATARICVRQVQVFTSSMAPFSGFHFPLPI